MAVNGLALQWFVLHLAIMGKHGYGGKKGEEAS
jgi:hypothetical protein